MTTAVDQITSPHWQPRLGAPGLVVLDEGDIAQCIAIILKTRRGEDVLRPEFGCGIWDYIDQPINAVKPRIIREALEAIQRWEQRVRVVNITATHNQLGQLVVMVQIESDLIGAQAIEVLYA